MKLDCTSYNSSGQNTEFQLHVLHALHGVIKNELLDFVGTIKIKVKIMIKIKKNDSCSIRYGSDG